MDDVNVVVRTPLHATERRQAVEDAVLNLFPDAEFEDENGTLVARSNDVSHLRELVDRQEIHQTAREQLADSVVGDTVVFRLSKQPATVGRLNFDVGGHELGALRVRVETDDPDGFVDYVAGADA
ncbi:MAG: RNA-binding domain-containing protein [Halobacteria archaeon]